MELLRASNPELVELSVLGFLCERSRHPYDMARVLRQRGHDAFLRGLPRSLYHAVDALLASGDVEAAETLRDGARPERTVFRATEAGRAAFRMRLLHLLATPSDQPTFYAALAHLPGVGADDAKEALGARLDGIADAIAATTRILAAAEGELPRLVLVEVEYVLHQLRGESDWVRAIVDEIHAGTLSWELTFGPSFRAPED